jgi:hypothetical protein
MEVSATSAPNRADAGAGAACVWLPIPTVLWPWACQLLVVDASTVAVDLVSSAARRIRGTMVEAGTPFSIRVAGVSESSRGDLADLAGWATNGERVTLLASQHRRSSWACLSLGRRRVVLTGVESNLGFEAPVEQSGPVASDREPQRVLTTQFCTRG